MTSSSFAVQLRVASTLRAALLLDALGYRMSTSTLRRLLWGATLLLLTCVAGAAALVWDLLAVLVVDRSVDALVHGYAAVVVYLACAGIGRQTLTRQRDVVAAPQDASLYRALSLDPGAAFLAWVAAPALRRWAFVLVAAAMFIRRFEEDLAAVVSPPATLLILPTAAVVAEIAVAAWSASGERRRPAGAAVVAFLVVALAAVGGGRLASESIVRTAPRLLVRDFSGVFVAAAAVCLIGTLAVLIATVRLRSCGLGLDAVRTERPMRRSAAARRPSAWLLVAALRDARRGTARRVRERVWSVCVLVVCVVVGLRPLIDRLEVPDVSLVGASVVLVCALAQAEVTTAQVGPTSWSARSRVAWEAGQGASTTACIIAVPVLLDGVGTGIAVAGVAFAVTSAPMVSLVAVGAVVGAASFCAEALVPARITADGSTTASLAGSVLAVVLSTPALVAAQSQSWLVGVLIGVWFVLLAGGGVRCVTLNVWRLAPSYSRA